MSSRRILAGMILMALVLAAYLPALQGGFIWDDMKHVSENILLWKPGGLSDIWLKPRALPQYYPLVHTSFWMEYRLWKLNPAGYHLVNVLIQGLNAVLVWLAASALGIPGAWLAGLIFGLHPVQVESVAWITERKNVLSGFFYLASLLAYLKYAGFEGFPPEGKPATGSGAYRRGPLALSMVLYAAALLSKTVTATLPAALLIILWWRRDRLGKKDILPLGPMVLAGAGFGMLTVWLERFHVGATGIEWDFSPVERILIAGRAFSFYLGKLIWPVKLTFIYPRWTVDARAWWQYLYPAAVPLLAAAFWRLRRRCGKGPLAALLFFGVSIAPALGFFNVYPMRYSFVADHFQYLASIGPMVLFSALAAGTSRAIFRRMKGEGHPGDRRAAAWRYLSLSLVAMVLGTMTWKQCAPYRNLESLWRDVIAKNPSSWMAYNNLGNLMFSEKRYDEARVLHLKSLELNPANAEAHYNLGYIALLFKRWEEAHKEYRILQTLSPPDAQALLRMILYAEKRDKDGPLRGGNP